MAPGAHFSAAGGFFLVHGSVKSRKAAQDQPHKGHAGDEGMVFQQIFDGVGEAGDAQDAAQKNGGQQGQAFLHMLCEAGNTVDQPVVNAERNGHGAAGYAGDHVGNADHDALDDIEDKFHNLLLLI